MSENEISINIDESEIAKLKDAINYNEIEAIHQRFIDGTETEDDLINGIIHYLIENDKGLNLDVVEYKYYRKIVDLYSKEKEKNGILQKELDKKIKALDKAMNNPDYISKDKIADILERYKYTEVVDTMEIIEFYKAIQNLLEEN